ARIRKSLGKLPVEILVVLDDQYAHDFPLPCRNDDFSPARTLPVFGRYEDDDHTDSLAASRLRPGFRELATFLGGNLLADGITIGRGGGHRHGRRRRKGGYDKAWKRKTAFHSALLLHRC